MLDLKNLLLKLKILLFIAISIQAFEVHAEISRLSTPSTIFFAFPDGPILSQTSPDSDGVVIDKIYINSDSQGLSHEITYSSTEKVVLISASGVIIESIERFSDSFNLKIKFRMPSDLYGTNEAAYINLFPESLLFIAANESNYAENFYGTYWYSYNTRSSSRPFFFDDPYRGVQFSFHDFISNNNLNYDNLVIFLPEKAVKFINKNKVLSYDKLWVHEEYENTFNNSLPAYPVEGGVMIDIPTKNLIAEDVTSYIIHIGPQPATGFFGRGLVSAYKGEAARIQLFVKDCKSTTSVKVEISKDGSDKYKRFKTIPLIDCQGEFSTSFKKKAKLRFKFKKNFYYTNVKVFKN